MVSGRVVGGVRTRLSRPAPLQASGPFWPERRQACLSEVSPLTSNGFAIQAILVAVLGCMANPLAVIYEDAGLVGPDDVASIGEGNSESDDSGSD